MSRDKFVKVPHRLLNIGKNGIVGNEDDFLGRRKRSTWQRTTKLDFLRGQGPEQNSFMRRVGVPFIH
jgi:hypothetical protein